MSAPNETDGFVAISGGELYVKQWMPPGAAATTPLILLHDSVGCVQMWRSFPRSLAARLGRRVIAYDRLGFGRSSARAALPSIRFVTEEAEIVFPVLRKALDLSQFIVVGHSVGGAMAVIVAARSGAACRAVITESSQAFVEPQTLQAIAAARVKFNDSNELAKLQRFHGDKARWVVDAWTETWLTPEFKTWSLKSELSAVTCPLLALHGDADEYGSMAFPSTLSTGTAGPAEMHIVKSCGHVPHREREGEVLDTINSFLERALRFSALGSPS